MKRYPAYDPPEYVDWKADPEAVRQFGETLSRHGALVQSLDEKFLLELYAGLLRTRLIDITLKRWVRTGVISKAWLSTGEEAATVGPVHALDRVTDYVAPMIRNSGACNEMGMPLADILRGYLGTADGPSRGRDGHYGDPARHVIPPISHVGDMVPVVAGIALAGKIKGTGRLPVVMNWIGDGSTKTGTAHEAFNFAAVQKLPAIFIIQSNQVALGTVVQQYHVPESFDELPASYGIWGLSFDGNNVLDAWAAAKQAVDRCRAGDGPAMLVAHTFRMGGHATHDEREARATFPAEWFAAWGKRDPIGLFETWLGNRQPAVGKRLPMIEEMVEAEIAAAEQEALASKEKSVPDPATVFENLYA